MTVEAMSTAIVGIAWLGGGGRDGSRGSKIAALIPDDRTPEELYEALIFEGDQPLEHYRETHWIRSKIEKNQEFQEGAAYDVRDGMGGVGDDSCAASEVAREGLPGGEGDVSPKTEPEYSLGTLPLVVAVVVVGVEVATNMPPYTDLGVVRGLRRGRRGREESGSELAGKREEVTIRAVGPAEGSEMREPEAHDGQMARITKFDFPFTGLLPT
ncbi:hypothetical protein B296_00001108 [Ensete ventricosum]|uniref:Uncharacterized protein n=1 Tax=Ensete ventricosum TaxID=4639 RepID=A0A427AU26_ENSVE|nr:hypothetical protein B296_00001108 [Ensete ventricosum]